MDKKQHEDFIALARVLGYAFLIWKIGGLPPGQATVKRLDRLERKGRRIIVKYGGGVRGALSYMDTHHAEFRQFIENGLDRKFWDYWRDALVAEDQNEGSAPLH